MTIDVLAINDRLYEAIEQSLPQPDQIYSAIAALGPGEETTSKLRSDKDQNS